MKRENIIAPLTIAVYRCSKTNKEELKRKYMRNSQNKNKGEDS